MTASVLLAAVMALAVPPGDASRLVSGPPPVEPVASVSSAPGRPFSPRSPVIPAGAAVAVAGAAVVAAAGRRRLFEGSAAGPGVALGLRPPDDLVVVFVPGHASASSAETFADMVELMGLEDDQVMHFDYRWTGDATDHVAAARDAGVASTAHALQAYLTGVGSAGRRMHIVGYSKGGSAVAELVERWDRGLAPTVDGVGGVTLLDPPMATGLHGIIQGVGRWFGLPHDGGYDPVECSVLFWGCTDHRAGLGRSSGIDVAVVRSPDAAVTNFGDLPADLAVYEAPDAGPSLWEALRSGPFAAARAAEHAHRAVLSDPGVAACIVGQMSGAGCGLPPAGAAPPAAVASYRPGGPGGNLSARTV